MPEAAASAKGRSQRVRGDGEKRDEIKTRDVCPCFPTMTCDLLVARLRVHFLQPSQLSAHIGHQTTVLGGAYSPQTRIPAAGTITLELLCVW